MYYIYIYNSSINIIYNIYVILYITYIYLNPIGFDSPGNPD